MSFTDLDQSSEMIILVSIFTIFEASFILEVQSKSVLTNSSGPAIIVRYNRVNLCSKMTDLS